MRLELSEVAGRGPGPFQMQPMAALAQRQIKQMGFRDEAKRELALSALGRLLQFFGFGSSFLSTFFSPAGLLPSTYCPVIHYAGPYPYNMNLQSGPDDSRTTSGPSCLTRDESISSSGLSLVLVPLNRSTSRSHHRPRRRLNDHFVCGDL
jgi:hypothetical protein